MGYMEEYKNWLTRFADDAELVAELESIAGDEKEIEDRFYTDLAFGTAGLRGVLGMGKNRMNIYNVRVATMGLARYLISQGVESQGVVIAYDSRIKSDVFAKETALVLAAAGVKAYLFDSLRPVPVLSFAVRHLNTAAGVVITASHNPPQYNGYKAYGPDGAQLAPEAADEVTKYIRALSYEECVPMAEEEAKAKGLLKIIGKEEVDDAYIEMVKSLSLRPELLEKKGGDLKIVYTPLHGSGNVPVRRLLQELGVTHVSVVAEQEAPDGRFPTVTAPNPEDPAAFKYAIPLAEKVGATVVFGTDPDCDRMGVAVQDGEGVFHTLTGNQIACLMLDHILSSLQEKGKLPKNGAAVKSVVSTEMAKAICDSYGVKMYDVLTGFKFIGEKIQQFEETGEHTFLFGFEESYGYLSGTRVRDKDGVNASLLLCEAACACMDRGETLYDALQRLYKKHGYFKEIGVSVTLPGKDGAEKIKAIMQKLQDNPPADLAGYKVTALRDFNRDLRIADGVEEKMGFPKSNVLYFEIEGGNWVCVRPSGTEPKIKLYIASRGETEEKNNKINAALAEAAKALMA
ncbi:MAG: phospho-sugar mutase [Clostridiales bacterium]|nr:phospho-sugar mutase [Clostridiales bacterium]